MSSVGERVGELRYRVVESPVGELVLTGTEEFLSGLWFSGPDQSPAPIDAMVEDPTAFQTVVDQLGEYFDGQRESFEVNLAPEGTEFQLRVWRALRDIPYGETCSYGDIAKAVGVPKGSRAVGLANGRNPISIIVPCHRVIGADGSLTGYGGGMDRKKFLLDLESSQQSML
ncbi:MAG: methylated-DNA--[protein]-cysteine S-methyltransferase [Acidimicrobiales bacterium]|nr:methylated-DNA--[protein]-cysteine S-methyltransferase [Acidimicrobiales bacterium]